METYLINLVTLLGGGMGVYLATAGVKKLKALPINEGQTVRIRAAAAVFSALAVALAGIASGNLAPENLQDVLVKLIEFGTFWFTAHGVHKIVKE